MNAYDFDKTIFYPDSSVSFYLFCLKKHPLKVLRTVPISIIYIIKYKLKQIGAKELKERLFSYLRYMADIDVEVQDFWIANKHRIGKWYLNQKSPDDVIISASPEFLLKPICEELSVSLIGTKMDKQTGKIIGENCHDVEKVKRFINIYPLSKIHKFYSDSMSDQPMADLAEEGFLVNKHTIRPWPKQN